MRKGVSIEDRTRAIQLAVREALREHAIHGESVCVSGDEKVVWLSPEEVLGKFCRTEAEYQQRAVQDHHD
jgi:hypothetical protein